MTDSDEPGVPPAGDHRLESTSKGISAREAAEVDLLIARLRLQARHLRAVDTGDASPPVDFDPAWG